MSKQILGYEPGPEYTNEDGYRYIVDGEVIKEFDDEATARMFFDEGRAACEAIARDIGTPLTRYVYDDTGYKSVKIEEDVCLPERPKFVRVDREKLCTACSKSVKETA